MKEASAVVKNDIGIHGRPATFFNETANCFKCAIWLEIEGKVDRRVNAKSLLGVLSIGIVGGTKLKIIADGPDEEAAAETLAALINCGFSEPDLSEILRSIPRNN